MENHHRGRKRTESVDQLPLDKRACSSSSPDSNTPAVAVAVASSSSSPPPPPPLPLMGFNHSVAAACVVAAACGVAVGVATGGGGEQPPEIEMDAASTSSISGQSEAEPEAAPPSGGGGGGGGEKEASAYGSCESDGSERNRNNDNNNNNNHEYEEDDDDDDEEHHYRIDQEKFKKILKSLSEDIDPSNQLSGLTQLCDILAFCTENSISGSTAEALSPILVTLAKHESNPDIMLFAIRAITYLCDVLPRSSGLLVRYDAVPALCSRLLAIEYLDVAEQCLLALEKISGDHPLACLQAGTIMAVLNYIDFFSSSVQRIALATVSNICRKLPSDSTAHFMEAVPVLCNLLQYEDQKLVETVATCLIRIADRVSKSPEMVEELCKHNLIHQVIHLIALNSHTTLSQPVYNGLIGLLSKLAAASSTAVRTLFELNISSTVKHILSSYDVSHGMPSSLVGGDGNSNQVQEVLKLLNVLLPPLERNHDDGIVSDKEKILKDQPELLQRFGIDILPVLIQVVNCGANLYVCYGCLTVINKLVYFSRSEMLLDMLKNTNISSFLAGVFARNDHHVLVSALNTVETILQHRPDVFLNFFIKEGVVYAIDAILTPEKSSRFMFPASSCTHLSSSEKQKLNAKDAVRCLCYSLNISRPSSSETGTCKLEKDSAHTLAKRIKATYFATESQNSEIGLTEILRKLRNFCAVLSDQANVSRNDDMCAQQEEKLFRILGQIIMELNTGESVSTFEFIESGIVKSLLTYLSNGQYLKGKVDDYGLSDYSLVVLKRFVMFASFSLSPMTLNREDMPLTVLVRKLQMALSSLENFPVILSHISKPRNSYAAIPTGHYTRHPCLKVRFLNEEGETALCDGNANVVNVEPFTSFDSIEKFLRPNVSTHKDEQQAMPAGQSTTQSEDLPVPLPSDERSPNSEDLNLMETHNVSSDEVNLDSAKPDQEILPEVEPSLKIQNSVNANSPSSPSTSEVDMEHGKCPTSSSNEDTPQKLMFYLDGRQLDHTLTLYQAILQLQLNEENDMIVGPNFWNEVYKVTCRKTVEPNLSNPQDQPNGTRFSTSPNYAEAFCQNVLCFSSTLMSELPGNLEKSNPAAYEILILLKILEVLNKSVFHLMSHDRVNAFAVGKSDNLDSLMVSVSKVPQAEFLSSKLSEKLEQQMGDPLAVSSGCMPSWCSQLISECPFLFSFEARCKYFRLTAFGSSRVQPLSRSQSANDSNSTNDSRLNSNNLPRKKFQVDRNHVLESAAKMMNSHAGQNIILEVEYGEEVGTGLGPTLEFYTLVSHEFQKFSLGMWRGDHSFLTSGKVEDSGCVVAPLGLFPRPWSTALGISNGVNFSEVMKKFVLLGQVIAKALQDGRVLDIPLSKAFYKIILDQELNIYDIQSFDPSLGRALLEFQALVDKKRMGSVSGDNSFVTSSCFRNTSIDDLYLDFTTLPGYPDYMLTSDHDHKMVNISNLDQYVSLIVDATVSTGISRQVEAFKSGFNQVFPITSLKIFTEEEIDHLLCGERDAWTSTELLDHIKFDHGYTASSPPIIYLLEIIQEFKREQQQAFLQFVTGAPRLPHGGLAALNPKMTIVRKHCSDRNGDLPSVMTCANYLKLPSYSSKEIMRERLMYAITEGQGSFHLS